MRHILPILITAAIITTLLLIPCSYLLGTKLSPLLLLLWLPTLRFSHISLFCPFPVPAAHRRRRPRAAALLVASTISSSLCCVVLLSVYSPVVCNITVMTCRYSEVPSTQRFSILSCLTPCSAVEFLCWGDICLTSTGYVGCKLGIVAWIQHCSFVSAHIYNISVSVINAELFQSGGKLCQRKQWKNCW